MDSDSTGSLGVSPSYAFPLQRGNPPSFFSLSTRNRPTESEGEHSPLHMILSDSVGRFFALAACDLTIVRTHEWPALLVSMTSSLETVETALNIAR